MIDKRQEKYLPINQSKFITKSFHKPPPSKQNSFGDTFEINIEKLCCGG